MLSQVQSDTLNRQSAAAHRKVWYHSPEGDLYVWYDSESKVAGYEISCFDVESEKREEFWVRWDSKGLKTGTIDSKEVDSRPHDIKSPTVDMGGPADIPLNQVTRFLVKEGGGLPVSLISIIRSTLETR